MVEGLTGTLARLRVHQVGQRIGFKRQFPGEDLVEHQAERSRCRF